MDDGETIRPPLTFRYLLSALSLWLRGAIRTRILIKALRERPIAVCGPRGAYQVDTDFDDRMRTQR